MKIWYILRGKEETGPFSFEEIVSQMQNRKLFDYDYVWCSELPFWTQVKDVEQLSSKNIALHYHSIGGATQLFKARQFPRKPVEMKFYGHNDIYSFDGTLISLSQKGALLVCNTRLVEIGDPIHLFFFEQQGVKNPFKVNAQVLNKKPSEKVSHLKSMTPYCIEFSPLKNTTEDIIKDLVK